MLGGYLHELSLFPKKINSALIFVSEKPVVYQEQLRMKTMLRYLHLGPVLHFLITQRKPAHNYFFQKPFERLT